MPHSKSQFYQQAVTRTLSLGVVADLLHCARDPFVREVRYSGLPPREFGLFLDPKVRGEREFLLDMPVHERISINELCEVAHLVVSRIAEYDEAREKAQRAQEDMKRRVDFLMQKFKHYGIDPDYVQPPPEKLYRKDAAGNYVEVTHDQY